MKVEWSGAKIKELRLSLGWSVAELARRLSCSTDLICEWERSDSQPDQEMKVQLNSLQMIVEKNRELVSKRVQAEFLMVQEGLDQVHHDDLDN
ncbi:MAG: helix-turn-helix transcriptional regulator [Bdellovibrionales bacterium]|nr:helix-turn-helix transcriptional regulator [Bdellovibrionales bacterium]